MFLLGMQIVDSFIKKYLIDPTIDNRWFDHQCFVEGPVLLIIALDYS